MDGRAALAADTGATLDALLEKADNCLYAAKHSGRNRVSLLPGLEAADVDTREPEAVGMARALAFAVGLREGIPEEHSEQVSRLAVLAAEQLRLPARVILRCRLAGLLHDVGKVAIPESILNKPGPLDDAEWAIMRAHPVVGASIVGRVPGLQEAARAVRHHHERYAGDGYPDGLAGAAIPLEARIIAAADAYAAMHHRPPLLRSPAPAPGRRRAAQAGRVAPGSDGGRGPAGRSRVHRDRRRRGCVDTTPGDRRGVSRGELICRFACQVAGVIALVGGAGWLVGWAPGGGRRGGQSDIRGLVPHDPVSVPACAV